MLLVDNHHTQSGKLYGILDDGMSANEYLYGTIEQSVEYLLSPFAFDNTRQQGYADGQSLQEVHDGLQVLFGKYLGGGHDAGLITVVQCDEHRHQCYECLARAYVTLQQTVHLATTAHILANLADNTFLGFR